MLGKYAIRIIVFALAASPCVLSQAAPEAGVSANGGVGVATAGGPHMAMRGPAVAFRTELMDTAPIKGSPFCATVVNEHTQVFADGNKIHTSENSLLCRDGEGRTRRESQLNLLGALPQGQTPRFVTILDPVAGYRYFLDTNNKTARKSKLLPSSAVPGVPEKSGQNVMIFNRTVGAGAPEPGPGQTIFFKRIEGGKEPDANSENLGDQMFGPIHATGSRVTTTIPAGKMGNEKPMNVVSEDWYSPELKTMVKTVHTDPWAGELTTQLTNVNTTEPDASLFAIPSDYKVTDDNSEPFMLRVPPMEPEK
jgi:hypothetical protein